MTTTPAPITTTLNRIRAHRPCKHGWEKLLAGLGKTTADDEPLPYARIVEINGLEDALWACRVEPQHAKEWRLFAVWCARQVEHLMTDQRSRDALNVAEAAEAAVAAVAARAAAEAAWAVAWAARADAEAAVAAAWAARAAAWAAARATAEAAQRKKFLEIVGKETP
jgi:hypothetical protein